MSTKPYIAQFNAQYRQGECLFCSSTPIQWHHLNPQTKTFTINYADAAGKSTMAILWEISKCIPLCRKCHAKLHHPKAERNKKKGKNRLQIF